MMDTWRRGVMPYSQLNKFLKDIQFDRWNPFTSKLGPEELKDEDYNKV